MPFDPFPSYSPGPDGSATYAAPVVPNDNADLPMTARTLFVGTAGDVTVVMRKQVPDPASTGLTKTVTFKNVASGATLKISVVRVCATGTTASNIVALA